MHMLVVLFLWSQCGPRASGDSTCTVTIVAPQPQAAVRISGRASGLLNGLNASAPVDPLCV